MRMRSLFWTALLLSSAWVLPVVADECGTKAEEIASKMGLDAGSRTPADFIPLSARTDDDDDYGAYLMCKGTPGLTLEFMSPPSPGTMWFDFVGRSGAILTGVKTAAIALEAKNCVENARFRKGSFRSPGSAFQMVCKVGKMDGRAEIYLAGR